MIAQIYEQIQNLVNEDWKAATEKWGERVALYREYEEGEHRSKMTTEMKKMLRVSGDDTDEFNANYCELVVQTMADRLKVQGVKALGTPTPGPSPVDRGGESSAVEGQAEDAGQAWVDELMAANRFDGLQIDVHEASIRDGITFVMVWMDPDTQRVVFNHELAWDGDTGVIPVYDRMRKNIVAAVKVWYEAAFGTERRVNIYYPDRVEKLVEAEGKLNPLPSSPAGGGGADSGDAEGLAFPVVDGRALGVPIIAFENGAKSRRGFGKSVLKAAVPMQDALNRTNVSMVMTSELTAFQLRYAIGFEPPQNISPGMFIQVGNDALTKDQQVDIGTLDQGDMEPFLKVANYWIDQIGTITRTPLPAQMGGDSQSGEALKQREVGLLGKVERFQVKAGNAWEDVFTFAQRVQTVFDGPNPPAVTRFETEWEDAQIRNETEVVDNALKVREHVGQREFLRLIGYDKAAVDRIIREVEAQQSAALRASVGVLPGFDQFGNGTEAALAS